MGSRPSFGAERSILLYIQQSLTYPWETHPVSEFFGQLEIIS
jgi:hypothetical protein